MSKDRIGIGWPVGVNQGKNGDFKIDENGVMRFRDKFCVLDVSKLKKSVFEECHKSGFSIYSDATKMY